jgi:small subunit ribosomal protein S20
MAHHKSAKKRIERNERRRQVNRARLSRLRTFIKKVETAIASGNQDTAREALRAAQPELMRGADKGVIHDNAARRKLSRLSARIKALGG